MIQSHAHLAISPIAEKEMNRIYIKQYSKSTATRKDPIISATKWDAIDEMFEKGHGMVGKMHSQFHVPIHQELMVHISKYETNKVKAISIYFM